MKTLLTCLATSSRLVENSRGELEKQTQIRTPTAPGSILLAAAIKRKSDDSLEPEEEQEALNPVTLK